MNIRLTVIGAIALAILCEAVSGAQTTTKESDPPHLRYRFIDLGTLGGPGSVLPEFQAVVNDRGTAAGGADLQESNPGCANPIFLPDCNIQHAVVSQHEKLVDLGNLGRGNNSFAFAINRVGMVAGASEVSASDPVTGLPASHAVLWFSGRVRDLGTLGGTSSAAVWNNDWGQATGPAQNAVADSFSITGLGTETRAFLWTDGRMRDLGTLGGPDSFGQYVNNRGQVAGVSYTSDTPDPITGVPQLDPFLWENDKMKDLGNLGGTNGFLGPFVFGLNNHGQVVGTMITAGNQTAHAFLWDGERMMDLGTFGGTFSGATGLNDAEEVIGYSGLTGDAVSLGFFWRNGIMHSLPPVDGDVCTLPIWINSRGQVVGTSSADCNIDLHAVLWDRGTAIDLNQFLPPGSGDQLVNAVQITDDGIIAGALVPPGVPVDEGDRRGHAFLLIPCESASSPDCIDQAMNSVHATRNVPSIQSSLTPSAPGGVARARAYIGARIRRYRLPGKQF